MIRKKLPSDKMLRRKLMICLLQNGKQQDYVYILVGYSIFSLDHSTQHFIREHPEVVDPEWLKLLGNDTYREHVVTDLLEKYKSQISAIPDKAVSVIRR